MPSLSTFDSDSPLNLCSVAWFLLAVGVGLTSVLSCQATSCIRDWAPGTSTRRVYPAVVQCRAYRTVCKPVDLRSSLSRQDTRDLWL
jgi:hypothetical protein